MTDDPSLTATTPDADERTESVRGTFTRLYADGRAYAEAEIEKQKLRAGIAGAGVRDALIFGVAGGMILFAGLIAFLVGIVLLLTPPLGPGWAAVVVFGASLLVTILLLLLAKGRITKMKKAIQS